MEFAVKSVHIGEAIEKRRVELCYALDFNFFTLFCEKPPKISAYLAAMTLYGDANNSIR